jgi:hypothetical protein
MQGLRFRTNPPYGGAVEILSTLYHDCGSRTQDPAQHVPSTVTITRARERSVNMIDIFTCSGKGLHTIDIPTELVASAFGYLIKHKSIREEIRSDYNGGALTSTPYLENNKNKRLYSSKTTKVILHSLSRDRRLHSKATVA